MGSRDLNKSRELYVNLGHFCEQSGVEPYIPHLNTDPNLYPNVSEIDVFEKDFDQLISSQIMVCYIGEPSLGVGAEIVFAVKHKLRIITVIEKNNKASRFVLGLLMKYNNHTTIQYSDVNELRNKLTSSLGKKTRAMTAYNNV